MHTQPGLLLPLKTKRNDIFFRRFHEIVNEMRLSIYRSQMFHALAFL